MDEEMRHLEKTNRPKFRAMQRRLGVALSPEPGDHCLITPLPRKDWNGRVMEKHKQPCGGSYHAEPWEVEMLAKNQSEAWLVRCLEHGTDEILILHAAVKCEVL